MNEVFEELHDKYKGRGQMAPELRLMMMVGGSGFMFHLTNSLFKQAMPNMNDILRQTLTCSIIFKVLHYQV